MTNNNRIPRQFNRITAKIKVDTSQDKTGDILHIFKNNVSTGYLALNTRTGKYAYMFVSMLRNKELTEILSIE